MCIKNFIFLLTIKNIICNIFSNLWYNKNKKN
ncbi:hypothetical protein QE7_2293, partial [Clostridioides difficile CD92]